MTVCDWKFYLGIYPDLYIRLVHQQTAVDDHYRVYGRAEKRFHTIPEFLSRLDQRFSEDTHQSVTSLLESFLSFFVFDTTYYTEIHNDLRSKSPHVVSEHYHQYGYRENRVTCLFNHYITHHLGIHDRNTQMWLFVECFDIDPLQVSRLCTPEVSHILYTFLNHIRQQTQVFPRPSWEIRRDVQIKTDSCVPLDFDWITYREEHSKTLFDRLCGRWYWVLQNILHPRLMRRTSDVFLHSSQKPMVYLVSNIENGGSSQYLQQLKTVFASYRVNYRQIRHVSDLQRVDDQQQIILWVSHIHDTMITADDLISFVHKKNVKRILLTVHDQTIFLWSSHIPKKQLHDPHYIHNKSLLMFPQSDTRKFLDMVTDIVCPSQYALHMFQSVYPTRPERFVYTPHPDICHYTRPIRYRSVTHNRIHLCIPHGVYYFKGEDVFPHFLHLLLRFSNIHLFIYGYLSHKANRILRETMPYHSYTLRGMYKDDELYDWIEDDHINGFVLLNDHPETYSYCFSKCVNTGLPCLFSDTEGAIRERIYQYSITGMTSLSPSHNTDTFTRVNTPILHHFIQDMVQSNETRTGVSSPPLMRDSVLSLSAFYTQFLTTYHTIQDLTALCHNHVPLSDLVKPFAIYFPQFYVLPENDLNFYKGMTDMISLKKLSASIHKTFPLTFPHPNHKSCLPDIPLTAFYDLSIHTDLVYQQCLLAQRFGLEGFAIYHYWFTHNTITNMKPTLEKLTQQFFNIPYSLLSPSFHVFFIWANGDWSDGTHYKHHTIKNTYSVHDLNEHIEYLVPFFKHDIYLKIENKPVFLLHYPSAMSDSEFHNMTCIFDEVCRREGFDGIHIVVNGISGYWKHGYTHYRHHPDGNILQKIRQQVSGLPIDSHTPSYTVDMNTYIDVTTQLPHPITPSIEVVFPSFNANARYFSCPHKDHINNFCTTNDSSEVFENMCSLALKNYHEPRTDVEKIFLVNAWNEWGEDMKLEPSVGRHFGDLQALYNALCTFHKNH